MISLAVVICTLRSRQNGRHFLDDILKCIFLNENVWISVKISFKFVPKVRIRQNFNIGSDNDLAPTRRQAIILTNDGHYTDVYMDHSASMS